MGAVLIVGGINADVYELNPLVAPPTLYLPVENNLIVEPDGSPDNDAPLQFDTRYSTHTDSSLTISSKCPTGFRGEAPNCRADFYLPQKVLRCENGKNWI